MAPIIEQSRTTQEQQQQDRGFEHLAAPALSKIFEMATFGPGPAAVRALFQIAPSVFDGMNIANGTNLPSIKNVLVEELLAEQAALSLAA
jgi:hypothetical protein